MNTSVLVLTIINEEEQIIKAFLTKEGDKHSLMFSQEVFGKKIHVINKEKIEKPASLIASYLSKSKLARASGKTFKSVMLDDDGIIVDVIYEKEDTEKEYDTYYIYKKDYILEGTEILVDVLGGRIYLNVAELGLKSVKLPKDFKYTKNKVLNFVLKEMRIPYDINRRFINKLNKHVTKIDNMLKNEQTFFIDKRTLEFFEYKKIPGSYDHVFNKK